jgi:hypothetical protein
MQVRISDWVTYSVFEGKGVEILVRNVSKDLLKVIIDDEDYEEEEEHFIKKSSLNKLIGEYDVEESSETETRLEETNEVATISNG